MNLGKSIRTLRKSLTPKVTQAEYAESIGITQSYLSCIENGEKEPSTDLLKKIADKHETPMPVFLWMSMDENDVHPSKLAAFKLLKPSVDALMNGFFIEKEG